MANTFFLMMATTAGFPRALVLDFLDQLGHGRWQDIKTPTLAWLAEYAQDCDSEYAAQVRWDAKCVRQSVNPGGYQRGRRDA